MWERQLRLLWLHESDAQLTGSLWQQVTGDGCPLGDELLSSCPDIQPLLGRCCLSKMPHCLGKSSCHECEFCSCQPETERSWEDLLLIPISLYDSCHRFRSTSDLPLNIFQLWYTQVFFFLFFSDTISLFLHISSIFFILSFYDTLVLYRSLQICLFLQSF